MKKPTLRQRYENLSLDKLLALIKIEEELFSLYFCWKKKAHCRRRLDALKTVVMNKYPEFR